MLVAAVVARAGLRDDWLNTDHCCSAKTWRCIVALHSNITLPPQQAFIATVAGQTTDHVHLMLSSVDSSLVSRLISEMESLTAGRSSSNSC